MKPILLILLFSQISLTTIKGDGAKKRFSEKQEIEIIKSLLKTEAIEYYIKQYTAGKIRIFDLTKTINPNLNFGYGTYGISTFENILLDINTGWNLDFVIYKFEEISDTIYNIELFYSPHSKSDCQRRIKMSGKGKILIDGDNIKFLEFDARPFQ